jgi:AcrR family transcriptional regulator
MATQKSKATAQALVDATVETLRERGFGATTSRAIAERAQVNQALVFYYFGSMDGLLLAALEHVSVERLDRHAEQIRSCVSIGALVGTLRTIYDEDRARGTVTVITEIVAGSVANEDMGPRVVELMEPWVDLVAESVDRVARASGLPELVKPRDVALAAVTFYLGANLMTRLDPEHAGIDGLLAAAEQALAAFE